MRYRAFKFRGKRGDYLLGFKSPFIIPSEGGSFESGTVLVNTCEMLRALHVLKVSLVITKLER